MDGRFVEYEMNENISQREAILEAGKGGAVRAIGFDMDGVLFGTKMFEAVQEVGIGASLAYMWKTWHPPKRQHFFDSLRVPVLQRDTGGMNVVHAGVELPSILTGWQCGVQSGSEAEADIIAYYDSVECPLSLQEKTIYKRIAHLMLHPETFVSTRCPLERGQAIVKELAETQPNILLFGLSNWDVTSFSLLQCTYPEVFLNLKVVIVSGAVHACKPCAPMYEHMLEELRKFAGFEDLVFSEILFVDDEDANVKGAQAVGMQGLLYDDSKE